MTAPRASFDPLRYGVRALGEASRAQASVAIPPPAGDAFAPRRTVPPAAREGAALSLRLFTGGDDDATRFVLRDDESLTFAPPPARAAAFFEAHAGALAWDDDEEPAVVVGFPLVAFASQGALRAAPLFSWSGARVTWSLGGAAWSLAPGARIGDPLAAPDALRLDAPEGEGAPRFALHAGLWSALFEVDGEALSALSLAGRDEPGRLVRAAVRALREEALDELPEGPLTRDDLLALCEAVAARAPPRREVRAHPHGLAMLLPKGDPTAGLRAELDAMLAEPVPRAGPLAVYLGAAAQPAQAGAVWTHGASLPTASQLAAARAFEGTRDLVAVCGPPGCGKTTLLHHVAAQAVAARALDGVWQRPPERGGTPWALVVASTNNAAVDHALAPFVSGRALPVGLRVGNRRVLAEQTAPALAAAIEALDRRPLVGFTEAWKAFDAASAPIRAHLAAARARHAAEAKQREAQEARAKRREKLLRKLERPHEAPRAGVASAEVDEAKKLLHEHLEAIGRLATMYLDRKDARPDKARSRWDEANAHRGAKLRPMLEKLAVEAPFGPLAGDDVEAAVEQQRAVMESALEALDRIRNGFRRADWQRELDALEGEGTSVPDEGAPPPLDPALAELALTLRDAWAWEQRRVLLPRLHAAHGRLTDAPGGDRRTPTGELLLALAPLFPVAGCTLLSTRGAFPLDAGVIDRLVVDEAGQCAPVYAAPALARAQRAMFTGDVAQLPPVYTLDDRVDDRLARGLLASAVEPFRMGTSRDTSAQRVAEARAGARATLVEHFRSQPAIVALASRWSGYALDVRTPQRSLAGTCAWLDRAVRVVPVRGAGERTPGGVVNEPEARKAVALVEALVGDGVPPEDVAVLSPFVGQSARIGRALEARGLGGVLVRTVHRLQGGERRVVIFSLTATERSHLRWVAERPHLLHVATSRAQDHLVLLFDPDRARTEPGLAPLVEALGR
ncbi:MAG: AAA domain-containing protein [Polyangiales bacterium]